MPVFLTSRRQEGTTAACDWLAAACLPAPVEVQISELQHLLTDSDEIAELGAHRDYRLLKKRNAAVRPIQPSRVSLILYLLFLSRVPVLSCFPYFQLVIPALSCIGGVEGPVDWRRRLPSVNVYSVILRFPDPVNQRRPRYRSISAPNRFLKPTAWPESRAPHLLSPVSISTTPPCSRQVPYRGVFARSHRSRRPPTPFYSQRIGAKQRHLDSPWVTQLGVESPRTSSLHLAGDLTLARPTRRP